MYHLFLKKEHSNQTKMGLNLSAMEGIVADAAIPLLMTYYQQTVIYWHLQIVAAYSKWKPTPGGSLR